MVDSLLFKEIRSLTTLSPSPETNRAFSKLVTFCLQADEKDITLQLEDIFQLQNLSSQAESEMEAYWAQKIIASKNPKEELLNFWYYANYSMLVDLEYANASRVKKEFNNVLFIGGGPLPLTSILLSLKYGVRCTVLEKDHIRAVLAAKLIKTLELEKDISIEAVDAMQYENYHKHDLIYVAALVGDTPSMKEAVISDVYANMKKESLLLCRHSEGARKLLYPSVSDAIINKMKPLIEVTPPGPIINSFFILQKT